MNKQYRIILEIYELDSLYSLVIGFTHSESVTKSLPVLPRVFSNSWLNALNYVGKGEFTASKRQKRSRIGTTRLAMYVYKCIIEASGAQQREER